MKKRVFLLAFFAMGFLSCTKEDANTNVNTENMTLENATVIVAGKLSFALEMNTGTVKVYRQQNGKSLLGFEDMNLYTGTTLLVYLSPTKTISSSSLKICSVIGLYGNALFAMPANVDFALFKYVIIQAERSEETIASAELT